MALSTDNTWRDIVTKDLDGILPSLQIILSTEELFRGSFCTHNTTVGEIKPYDGTVADRAVGWHFGDTITGNAAAPRKLARIIAGGFQARFAVTGLETTVITDYGKPVYISDDGTYTLTGTTTTMRVGEIVANSEGVTAGTNAWIAFRNMRGLVGGG